jgi:hypothetical protein
LQINDLRKLGVKLEPTFLMTTTPNPRQARALALLDAIRV